MSTCWVVTYYQPGEGPSEVVEVHESETGALMAMREFMASCGPRHWIGEGAYWSNSLTGSVIRADEAKVLP